MNLLFLTKFYPYGTGEAFIENEIKVLSEYFEKITIYACEAPAGNAVMRPLPDNVIAYKIEAVSKIKDITKGVSTYFSKDKYFQSAKKECDSLKQKAFLSYFEAKSQRIFRSIVKSGTLNSATAEPYILYSYWLFMTSRVGMLISEQHKPVVAFTRAHRYDLYENRNALNYLPFRTEFLDFYDNVFPCSDNGTEYLRKRYPDYAAGVKTALLGTLDHGIGKGSTDGVFRIVSCSRVEPVKRVPKILEALVLLENSGLQIEWTHIGGSFGYESLCKEAKAELRNIKYHFTGNMKNADVMELYASQPFDLLINVSSSEGLPVSIMEAISFGIPCVATDVGGTREIVIDGVTGRLIAENFDVNELAEIIKTYASGNMDINRDSCRKFWENHFQAIPNYRNLCRYVLESAGDR